MNQKQRTWAIILFVLYLLILTWMILFKGSIHTLQVLFLPEFRGINLIPSLNARETLLNFFAFVPLGIYMGMLAKDKIDQRVFLRSVVLIALISLLFETAQFILALGTSDITDLISNTLGGMAGLALYSALKKAKDKKADKVLLFLAGIGTALLLVFILAREIWPEVFEMGRSVAR